MFYIYTYRRKRTNLQLLITFLIIAIVFSQSFAHDTRILAETIEAESESAPAQSTQPDETTTEDESAPEEPKTEAPQSAPSDEPDTQSSETPSQPIEPTPTESITTDNDATVINETESNSDTGANTVAPADETESTTPTDTTIETGDAQSDATVVNETNTTTISENYVNASAIITGTSSEDINLLNAFEPLLQNPSSTVVSENTNSITVDNDADVENTADATANSGENTVADTQTANITTGDATAAAQVVNVVNQTLIGNNWVFAVITVVGNWLGDLILPGEGLLAAPATDTQNLAVTVSNDATIENDIVTDANSGENTAENGSVVTGDATATSGSITNANTTILENNWLYVLINHLDGSQESAGYTFESTDSQQSDGTTHDITVHNSADIANTVTASANTGGNSIMGSMMGAIQTGTATARAAAINMVNTTIIGNNWMFVVVNVFGNWSGEVVFAYPDLSVSTQLSQDALSPEESATYVMMVTNEGNATAKDVTLAPTVPETLHVSEELQSTLGDLKPGESKTISISLSPTENPLQDVAVELSANAHTATKEPNVENNSASDTLTVHPLITESHAKLKVSRKNQNISAAPGQQVEYSIEVSNKGDVPLYNVVVEDSLKNPNNESIGTYQWPIPIIEPDETYAITYTLALSNSAIGGTYASSAYAYARTPEDKKIRSSRASLLTLVSAPFILSVQASTGEDPQAAEAETATVQTEEELQRSDYSFPLLYWLGAMLGYFALLQMPVIRKYRKRKLLTK